MALTYRSNDLNLALLAAGCFLLALLACCKNGGKARVKSNSEAATTTAPENITGQFMVFYKSATNKTFAVHFSYLFCANSTGGEWSTKIDSDGGLNESGEKTTSGKPVGIKPNKNLVMSVENSTASDAAGSPNSADANSVNVPAGMSNNNTKSTTGNALVMHLDESAKGGANASANGAQSSASADTAGKKIFSTKDTAKDPKIVFEIVRGETGVWRGQNLEFDGFKGLLEASDAVPSCDWPAEQL